MTNTILTLEHLKRMWPHGNLRVPGLMEGIAASAPIVLDKYFLTTPLLVAHAMGQFSEECGGGAEMIENLNYSAEGLKRTWPAHFSEAEAECCAHNPRLIADIAYGGRMGNAPQPSDDGWVFRGRGLSQTTGRSAYKQLGEKVGLDLIGHPELLLDPQHALECACCDFTVLCGCLPAARQDNVYLVTKRLNGGVIGLPERLVWTRRWKHELGVK